MVNLNPEQFDPAMVQGGCFTCGHPIRSQTFRTYTPMSRYTYGKEDNIAGTVIHPEKAISVQGNWEHWPKGRNPRTGQIDEGPFHNVAHGVEHEDGVYPADRRTHAQDWERQHREWKAKQEVEMHEFTKKTMDELNK